MFNGILDQATADAMCTIVTIGFMAEQLQIQDPRQKTMFQYEASANPADQNSHMRLQQLIFISTGMTVDFTQIQPTAQPPFIIAKNPAAGVPAVNTVNQAFDQTRQFWQDLEVLAHQQGAEPHGAYIGGIAHPAGFRVIGPSRLSTYHPLYRNIPAPINDAYSDMAFEIVKTSSALNKVYEDQSYHPNAALEYENYNEANADVDFLPGDRLFGSIHGMVRAMLRYPQLPAGSVHVEYSLSPGTTKVASCIPCSIFMSANDHPASSTHLGRGDSWNFPNPNPNLYQSMEQQQDLWGRSVIRHFDNGRILLQGVMDNNTALSSLSSLDIGDNIPQFFLESLTFHDSFLNRMLRTLATNN